MPEREYRIGVFEHPGPRKVHVVAYSLWFNPDWDGCCTHVVRAASGKEARALAMAEHKAQHMSEKPHA